MTRRGYREGTIRQRKDGRWEARLPRDPGGRRKSFFGKSRREVQVKLAEGRRRQEQGMDGQSLTVARFLDHWLTEVAQPSVRSTSYERYRQVVRHHLIPALGSIRLHQLGVEPIQTMLNRSVRSGHSPEKIRAVLRNALNVAVKWRLLNWNPAALVDLPNWSRREIRALDVGEAIRLVAATKDSWLEPIVILALSTAMREGEILGLRWSDVDLSARTLWVTVQLQRVGAPSKRALRLVEVKSTASKAPVPLPEIAYQALLRRQEQQRVRSLQGLVFTTKQGRPHSARNLLRAYKALLTRAQLPQSVRFHDLRHSCASFLVAAGTDPKTVQAILRHSTVRLSLDTYAHAMPENLRQASQTIDRLLTTE